MIKLKLTMVLLILALVSNAQNVPVTWKKDFTGAIKWQKVSALGHYLVGTSDALLYVDQDTGKIIWSKPEFKNLNEDDVSQVGNSPLISVNQGTTIDLSESDLINLDAIRCRANKFQILKDNKSYKVEIVSTDFISKK